MDEPLRSGGGSSADAAVVIGVEDYAFLPAVPYARRDAEAFYGLMVYTRGVPAERVQLMKGANREQMVKALQKASASVGQGGRLWVYFAGHGATSQDGDLMLVGDDAKRDADVFEDRSLTLGEVHGLVSADTLVVVDACHAGVGRDGEALIPDARFAVPTFAKPVSDTHRVWTAASPGEISLGYAPAEHGMFTYFVVGALRGWADGELDGTRDGTVTLDESEAYVRRALAALNRRGQTPTLVGPKAGAQLTSGVRELGPDLVKLPQSGGSIAAVQVVSTDGYTRPFRYVGGEDYEDAGGRAVTYSELQRLVQGSSDGRRLQKRASTAKLLTKTGVAGLAVGGGALAVGSVAYAVLKGSYGTRHAQWEEDQEVWCSDGFFSTSSVCTDPEPVEPQPAPFVVPGVVIGGAGAAAFGVGVTFKAKTRREMADVASTISVQGG